MESRELNQLIILKSKPLLKGVKTLSHQKRLELIIDEGLIAVFRMLVKMIFLKLTIRLEIGKIQFVFPRICMEQKRVSKFR